MKGLEKVLIIGKVWPEPKSSAAGTRMMQLIHFFQAQGCELIFASTANESAFQVDLNEFDVQAVSIELNSNSFDLFIGDLQPNAVIFDRFMTEEQFGWRVMENCPSAIRILNTEDLHGLRTARHDSIKLDGTLNHVDLFNDRSLRELSAIYRCDVALMVSQVEMQLLENHYKVPSFKLCYLPLLAERKDSLSIPFAERSGFMFIGNFYHEPNWDALRFLKTEIWPIIRSLKPSSRLNVYGAYPGQKVMDLHSEKDGFMIHGRAEDALEVSAKARVSLVPLRFGAGIKGKILEAMSVGTPIVTTAIGAEAMTLNNQVNGFVEDDAKLFAQAAVDLCSNQAIWEKAQEFGYTILEQKFQAANHLSKFAVFLISLAERISDHRAKDVNSLLIQQQSLLSAKYLSKWISEKNKSN